jgi:hypothetical protein
MKLDPGMHIGMHLVSFEKSGVIAGLAVPSALCREFPLGTACAERNWASAKSNVLSTKPWNPVVNEVYFS